MKKRNPDIKPIPNVPKHNTKMGISIYKSKGQSFTRPKCLLDIAKRTTAIESVVNNNTLSSFRRTPNPDSIGTSKL